MAETFDAVLADVMGAPVIEDRHFDRLSAAHAAEVAERDARLNGEKFAHEQTKRALAEATETWTDEAGNTWRPPTAWAYAQSCRVRDELRQRAEAAERDAREAVGLLGEVSRNGWGKLGPADLIHESPLLERIDTFLAAIATTEQDHD